MSVPCPVCDAVVQLTPDAVVSELVRCRECGSELEITDLDPPAVREAPVEEEDWGQ